MQRTALVIGATGLVGQSLLIQLASLYQKVIIIARSQPKGLSESMHFYQLKDFNQLESFVTGLSLDSYVDAFSCLGTTMKQAGDEAHFREIDFGYNLAFAKACHAKGIRHFFLLSAMGADAHSRFFYNRVKGELELAVNNLGFEALGIFRPSLLLGKHDNRPIENLAQTAYNLIKPIIPKRLPVRPIEAERVAMAMALVANNWHIVATYQKSTNLPVDNKVQVFSNADMLSMTRLKR
ncbi:MULTISPECIES: NAD-dependent epimerase/dehydratase family protein [unclassified Moraxella]|uniref:NAD-dependent epimerase/dehydratase family protein n=1 Tax=unclassified Moraxella TaxID=2685852 RepID=UPI003AF5A49F